MSQRVPGGVTEINVCQPAVLLGTCVGDGKGKVVGGHRGLLFRVKGFGAMQALVVWAYKGPHAVSGVLTLPCSILSAQCEF